MARVPVLLSFVITFLPAIVAAQPTLSMSSADSVSLRLEVIRLVLGNTNTSPDAQTLWLVADTLPESPPALRLSVREREAIRNAYPRMRFVSPSERLLLCPPGREVRIPGSACPIRDAGVIVRVGGLRIDGDSAIAVGTVTKSNARGTKTWSQGVVLVFGWVANGWKYRGVRYLITT
jgi:hypothetical protein